ncbi:MAG: hypothetical protein JXA36_00465 [Coriobacteriia bacterium]|nr:hypothetical protein [Coriobacteriia bacterium]
MTDAHVSGASRSSVSVLWEASTDADEDPITYNVYRLPQPVTTANLGSATLVGTTEETSIEVDADPLEILQSCVWWYAVRATDGTEVSTLSKTMAPNVHGYRDVGDVENTVTCTRCHEVHGAYPAEWDYHDVELCYTCHGSTSEDSDFGAKSSKNIQRAFGDYEGQTAFTSWHRSTKMETDETECDACHSSHRTAYYYDKDGNYVASLSYPKMLRVQTGVSGGAPTYTYYTQATNPQGIGFCLACHGPNATPISYVGDSGIYSDTAGDHTYASGAAHSTGNVFANDAPATNPAVQCLACHNKHASATIKLIDYRGSGTTDPEENKQSYLCYKCHSAAGYAAEVAAGTATGNVNFAWNGRDMQAEFGQASRHPTLADSGIWVEAGGTIFTQTTQAEFETNTAYQLSAALIPDSVVLEQYTDTIDPSSESYLFAHGGGAQTFDQYRPADNAWNANNYGKFDPPANDSFSTATGSTLFSANGKVYVIRGGNSITSPMIRQYTPPVNSGTGTWAPAAITAFGAGFSTGAQAAVNSGSSVVYINRGGNTNAIQWWQYSGTTVNSITYQPGGSTASLGAGSAMAYAPGADRLFVVNRNGGTGNGILYYLSNPATKTGNQTFTSSTRQVTDAGGITYYNRLAHFRDGAGTEYLMMIGKDLSGNDDTVIVSSLSGTPVPTFLNIAPFSSALGDGCDLTWDGVDGGYLYAIRGSDNSMARIAIPASGAETAGNWGTWEALTATPWTQGAGAGIAFCNADPPSYTGLAYRTSGTLTTSDITIPSTHPTSWGTLSWTESEPSGTALSVKVQGWDGAEWDDLVTDADSPTDLSSFSVETYTKIRLVGLFTTSDTSTTPRLDEWSVTSAWETARSLTCSNCHNVHTVGTGGSTAWDMTRVSDPDNTLNAFTGTPTQFCLVCHDGVLPAATTTDTTLIPYSVGFHIYTDTTAPFFTGWNKTETSYEWANSGHANSRVSNMSTGCDSCHDPHASDQPRLLASSAYYTGVAGHIAVMRDDSTTYEEEKGCYVCHTSQRSTPTCTTTGCHPNIDSLTGTGMDVQEAFTATYRHPVEYSDRHSDTEGAAELGQSNRHSECVDCHDPHAARAGRHTLYDSKAGEVLRGARGVMVETWPGNWTAVASGDWVPIRLSGQTTDFEAYLCLKCHSSYSGQPFTVTSGSGTYTSTDVALEFNPSNQSEHNVFGQRTVMETAFTVNGSNYTWSKPATLTQWLKSPWTTDSMMTCTDCHMSAATTDARGPHGSGAKWLIDPAYPYSWNFYDGETNTPQLNAGSNTGMSRSGSGTANAGIICEKCHGSTSFTTMNNVHDEHKGRSSQGGYCRHCHVGIPHGWKRPRLLGYTTDPDPYATWRSQTGYSATGTWGTVNFSLKSYTPLGWTKDDCYAGCSSGKHPNDNTAWP